MILLFEENMHDSIFSQLNFLFHLMVL